MPESPTDFVSKLNPQRRWRQYSLRSLLVFASLVAVFFAWVGARYRDGQQTAAVIRELGGSASTWTHWDHRWGKVTAANFSGTDIGDQELARICDLGTLRVLNLERTNVTDAGVGKLKRGLADLEVYYKEP